MLGDDDLCQTAQILAGLVVVIEVVILRSVDETYEVGILLDSTRLTEVSQLRGLAFHALTRLDTTVELREGDDGDVQLFGEGLEASRDNTYLLLATAEGRTLGIHQLQVVDDDHLDAVLTYEFAGF